MAFWCKVHRGDRLLVKIAFCLVFPACSNNANQPKDGKHPGQDANQVSTAMKLNIGKCTLTGAFRESNGDAVAVEERGDSTLCLAAHGFGGKVGNRELGPVGSRCRGDCQARYRGAAYSAGL